jgi:8-oxo-dGTP pyrophosphatase MutT (NUDIX family)
MSEGTTPEGGDTPKRKRRRRRRRPGSQAATRLNQAQPTDPNAKEPTTGQPSATEQPPAKGKQSSKGKKQAKRSGQKPAKRSAGRNTQGKGPVHREISAGGVVYRRDGEEIEVVLASRRTRRGELAWGLAKGGIEEGETHEEAAVREVKEETGYHAEIEASLGDTRYFYVWEDARIRKTVHFFLMRCTGGDPDDRDDEMEDVRWFPLERALKRAAYRGEREVLGRAADLLR